MVFCVLCLAPSFVRCWRLPHHIPHQRVRHSEERSLPQVGTGWLRASAHPHHKQYRQRHGADHLAFVGVSPWCVCV